MTAIDCASSIIGDGPALFFIHGIGSCRQSWDEITQILKDDFTCITYDLRGHGDSPIPNSKFGIDELVEDLEALRLKLGIESGHFFGHSLGGMIGPAYAMAHPNRVLTLGLLSTAAFRDVSDIEKVTGVLQLIKEKGVVDTIDTFVSRWFTESFIKKKPNKVNDRIAQVLATNSDVFLNVFEIYAKTEMSPWLHKILSPCLVLTGEMDGGCNPRLNKLIASALPNSELIVLKDLKHSIMIENSPLVAKHIQDFLSNN